MAWHFDLSGIVLKSRINAYAVNHFSDSTFDRLNHEWSRDLSDSSYHDFSCQSKQSLFNFLCVFFCAISGFECIDLKTLIDNWKINQLHKQGKAHNLILRGLTLIWARQTLIFIELHSRQHWYHCVSELRDFMQNWSICPNCAFICLVITRKVPRGSCHWALGNMINPCTIAASSSTLTGKWRVILRGERGLMPPYPAWENIWECASTT